jgi:hypothetical protein
MPGAGFYAIGASRIVFGRDGRWYADGERITNPRIALLFSRHLVQRDDGTYALVMGDEKATVEVEDTPWAVIRVDGDPAHGFTVTLNDRTTEVLDPESLRVGSDHSFSCRVKGDARARFLRPAHNALARHVEPTDGAGGFAIRIRGRRYALTAGSATR